MNIVAIVGRPNVGKSTLFNRLTESRNAIVDETSGVTRDRQYGHSDWNGKHFSIIDTGGYVMGGDDQFEVEIRRQVSLAIDEADVILFVVDAREVSHPWTKTSPKCSAVAPSPSSSPPTRSTTPPRWTLSPNSTPSASATPSPSPASQAPAQATSSTHSSKTSPKAKPTPPTASLA